MQQRVALQVERLALWVAWAQDIIVEAAHHLMPMPGGHRLHRLIEAGDAQRGVHGDDAVAAEVQNRAQLAIFLLQAGTLLMEPYHRHQFIQQRLAAASVGQRAGTRKTRRAKQMNLAYRAIRIGQRERRDLATPVFGQHADTRAPVHRQGDGVGGQPVDQAQRRIQADAIGQRRQLAVALGDAASRFVGILGVVQRQHARAAPDERHGGTERPPQGLARAHLLLCASWPEYCHIVRDPVIVRSLGE